MRLILSISSDIGTALAEEWNRDGIEVIGTYRTWSDNCKKLKELGIQLIQCDFTDKKSVESAISSSVQISHWNVLVLAAGDQNPIGLFRDVVFDDWEKSVNANFMGMLRFLHIALNQQRNSENRTVIMFAGGGTNNATERYSAYTVSKIASIKMCELLDYELSDTKFTILGPGWVRTKIHSSTLESSINAGENYQRTLAKLASNDLSPVENVIACCNWVIAQPKEVVGGRNFSVVHDSWKSDGLVAALKLDSNIYKLRRFANEITFSTQSNNE